MPAPLSPELVGLELEPTTVSWTPADVLLYAVGVGARPPDGLNYLYEKRGPAVLPTYAVIPGMNVMGGLTRAVKLDLARLLHGEQATDVIGVEGAVGGDEAADRDLGHAVGGWDGSGDHHVDGPVVHRVDGPATLGNPLEFGAELLGFGALGPEATPREPGEHLVVGGAGEEAEPGGSRQVSICPEPDLGHGPLAAGAVEGHERLATTNHRARHHVEAFGDLVSDTTGVGIRRVLQASRGAQQDGLRPEAIALALVLPIDQAGLGQRGHDTVQRGRRDVERRCQFAESQLLVRVTRQVPKHI